MKEIKLARTMELINQYGACEKCGNEMIGNGEGALEITDCEFKRSCKCGWKVAILEIKEESA